MRLASPGEVASFERESGSLKLHAENAEGPRKSLLADFKSITILPGQSTSNQFHTRRESIFHLVAGSLLASSRVTNTQIRLRPGDTVASPNAHG